MKRTRRDVPFSRSPSSNLLLGKPRAVAIAQRLVLPSLGAVGELASEEHAPCTFHYSAHLLRSLSWNEF